MSIGFEGNDLLQDWGYEKTDKLRKIVWKVLQKSVNFSQIRGKKLRIYENDPYYVQTKS